MFERKQKDVTCDAKTSKWTNQSIGYILLLITVFVNVTFPKAGVKLGGIPLTVGNVFLLLTIVFWVIYVVRSKGFYFNKAEVFVICSIVYWAVRFLLVFVWGEIPFGELVGFVVPTVIYPFMFIVFNKYVTEQSQIDKIIKLLFWGSVIVCIFGFLQAIFGIERFSIPGLTVNLSDYLGSENWYAEKYNGVQEGVDYAKTVSTYQNGNLLGVNIILFGPMICESIENKFKRLAYLLVFAMFCVLTGSKTCWVGILLYLIIKGAPLLNKKIAKRDSAILAGFIALALPIAAIIFLSMFPQIAERFKDSFTLKNIDDLSGRSDSMNGLIDYFKYCTEWIIIGPYGLTQYWGSSYEMTYFCILMIGGLCGIFAFVVPVMYVVIQKLFRYRKTNRIIKGVVDGVIVYMIIAYVEGALWLPPTAINLWMVLAVGYKSAEFMKNKAVTE